MGFYGEIAVRGVINGDIKQVWHSSISKRFAETFQMPEPVTSDDLFNPNRKFEYYHTFSLDFLLEELQKIEEWDAKMLKDNILSIHHSCNQVIQSRVPDVEDLRYLQELIQDNLSFRDDFRKSELEDVIAECNEAMFDGLQNIHVVWAGSW
jgi:hypothetical protein